MQWSLLLVTDMRGPPKGPEIARLLGVSSMRPDAGPMGPAGTSKAFTSPVSPIARQLGNTALLGDPG